MTDDQLAAFVPDLERWEGSVPYMYRDTMGYVTVGVGNLLHDADEACQLPFQFGGVPATLGRIQQDFLRVISMAKGLPAKMYHSASSVELTEQGILDLTIRRLRTEFLPGLTRLFIGFDEYPRPAQSALVDIAWNCGIRGIAQFSHLLAACRERDWRAAAASCHRKSSRPERNQWTESMLLEAVNG